MALFDLSLEDLHAYVPARDEPAGFDAFWHATLDDARSYDPESCFAPVAYPLRTVEIFDMSFRGFGGQPIKAWLLLPRERPGRVPCVVEFIGYGGGRGFPLDWLIWSACGYAHLVMETRGQSGDTPDAGVTGGNQLPGFLLRGIEAPERHFYRRVFTDAARAVDAARAHAAIDPTRVAVAGGSQGGGIAIAAAGLVPEVAAALVDVPFLCHYRRATEITDTHPYREIATYLGVRRDQADTVWNTLAYIDAVNFAARATAPALFSVGLMDLVCPPSTVFAAYNHWQGQKKIAVYPYNGHEGGGSYHADVKVRFLDALWGAS